MNNLHNIIEHRNSTLWGEWEMLIDSTDENYWKTWYALKGQQPLVVTKLKLRTDDRSIAVSLIKKAMLYNVSEVVEELARKLARYHLFEHSSDNSEQQIRMINKYEKIALRYKNIVSSELTAEMFLISVNKDLIRRIKPKKIIEKLEGMLNELDNIWVDSLSFLSHYYELKFRKNQLERNNNELQITCEKALIAINSKRFSPPRTLNFLFTFPLLPIYLDRGEYTKALNLIQYCRKKKLVKKGQHNSYALMIYESILYFHNGEEKKAVNILKKNQAYPSPIVREHFKLLRAYGSLVGGEQMTSSDINELVEFSKDKQGYNISIIIIKLIFLLKENNRDRYIDWTESIWQYIKTYLNNNKESLRAKYFLKIMHAIPKSNFHPVNFKRKTSHLIEKLKQLPIEHFNPSVEVEVIPFEKLYDLVVFILGNREY